MIAGTITAWYQASRAKFFIATLIPLGLGAVVAGKAGCWDIGLWLIILSASFLVHLNTNLANDYFEYFSGADEGSSIGGSRVLQEGKISLTQMRNVMILFYLLALVGGIYILINSGLWWLALIMLFSFFSSLFYTAPPVRYGYRGLGEMFVALNMGPIMTAGTASALIGTISYQALYLSIPIAIMVAFILYYQSLSDIDDDKQVGKFTLAVKLGRSKISFVFRTFAIAAMLSIILLVIAGQIHPIGLITLPTILLLVKTDRLIRNTKNIQELHDRGGPVRIFYLINGIMLILVTAFL